MSERDPSLVVVEDDERFAETLRAEFQHLGYRVETATSLARLRELQEPFDFAVVDLRLGRDSGLEAVSLLLERDRDTRIVMLTGYGSIATAVQATKLGAANYLTKPVDTETIERALRGDEEDVPIEVPEEFQSLARHEREYIEYVLAECDGNISRAARRLGIHRQSLQRKLRKYTPR
ncbi:MAG: response regulator transcription factor [Myxococcota bacterium]